MSRLSRFSFALVRPTTRATYDTADVVSVRVSARVVHPTVRPRKRFTTKPARLLGKIDAHIAEHHLWEQLADGLA